MAVPDPDRRAAMRRALLHMALWVVALHATAIGIYEAAGIAAASRPVRNGFMVAWLAATFAVVSVYLRRIRLLRGRGRPR